MIKIAFFEKYLDPSSRIAEILFGLIMVLSFTLTAGILIKQTPNAARELLLATLGCNIAWGIIDGAFYIMNAILDHSQRNQTVLAIQKARDETSLLRIIGDRLDDTLLGFVKKDERQRLYQSIAKHAKEAKLEKVRLNKEDFMGALASCILVILATLPAIIPFLFLDNAYWALRLSNLLLILLLFFVGVTWAKYTQTNRWGTGLVFMVIGLCFVGLAIALGG